MKLIFHVGTAAAVVLLNLSSGSLFAQTKTDTSSEHLYIDVHHLGAGNVTAAAVAKAHAKDLAVEGKHGVHFIQYWVDEASGDVYCLSQAPDSNAIIATHREAHGLLPAKVVKVTAGATSPDK